MYLSCSDDHDTDKFDDDEAHAGLSQATENTAVTFEGTGMMLLPLCTAALMP
jgi:hypothetical protein